MVIFGFCKDWAVEKCTEPVFKMFRKPRNEQNKSWYFFLKRPVANRAINYKFEFKMSVQNNFQRKFMYFI